MEKRAPTPSHIHSKEEKLGLAGLPHYAISQYRNSAARISALSQITSLPRLEFVKKAKAMLSCAAGEHPTVGAGDL
jgi:hypothetical protein